MKYVENTFKIQTEEPSGQVVKAYPDVCTVIVGSRLNADKQAGRRFYLEGRADWHNTGWTVQQTKVVGIIL